MELVFSGCGAVPAKKRDRPVSVSRRWRDGLMAKKHVVYILYSEGLGSYYTGQTDNIEKRLITHNSGGKKYTTRGIPWKLTKIYHCDNRSEAVLLERKIKKRGIKRYLDEN